MRPVGLPPGRFRRGRNRRRARLRPAGAAGCQGSRAIILCFEPGWDEKWACAHFFSFGAPIPGTCLAKRALRNRCGRRRRASREPTVSRFSTCSSGARRAAWCCGSRSTGPAPAATAEESVSVEDCARVSRDLSAVLDVEDIVPTAYTLEVSSPGLDRPLRHADDYRRFAGRRAKIVMRAGSRRAGVFQGAAGRGRRRFPGRRPDRR